MNAVIKISSAEFNEELFQKIKQFLKGKRADITIAVQDENEAFVLNEPDEHYQTRLNKAIDDIETGKGITYSMEEFEALLKK